MAKVDDLWAALRDPENDQFELVDAEIDGKKVVYAVTEKAGRDEVVAILLPTDKIRKHILSIVEGEDDLDEEDEGDDEEAEAPRARRFKP